MRLLLVDDEAMALRNLENKVRAYSDKAEMFSYQDAEEALAFIQEGNGVDVALLDVDMYPMSGLELAKELKGYCPHASIIFVTGYREYAIDAFKVKASGYLMKPVQPEELKKELDYVQLSLGQGLEKKHRMFVRCFGSFEVFLDDEPIHFSRQKSKELFAYLVDRRGSQVSFPEVAGILWEDGIYGDSRRKQLHNILSDLKKNLQDIGMEELLIKNRNSVAVNVGDFDCDLFAALDGDPNAINLYEGEYMIQYSWAEMSKNWYDSKN